jgi:hypothetical protein
MALASSRFAGGTGGSTTLALGGKRFEFDKIPGIREADESGHGAADERDQDRIDWATFLYDSQDDVLRRWMRQVEENVRMLAGQQWSVFNPRMGRFIDVTQWMTAEEKRWRQRPVFNRLLTWFIITHARMTENPPIITFTPGPDRVDALLSETMDVIFKTKWRETKMQEVWDRASAWLIPAGMVYLQSTIDMNKGPFIRFEGQPGEEDLQGFDPEQQEVLRGFQGEDAGNIGFDEAGLPQFDEETGQVMGPEAAHAERKGDLAVEVLNPVQVRGQWGPAPWHDKDWHMIRSFLTQAEIFETYGVKIEGQQAPKGGSNTGGDTGVAERLTYGDGYFGAADPSVFGADFSADISIPDPTIETFTLWHRPAPYAGMEESPEEAGGRLLILTRKEVLHDTTRPVRYPSASPIRRFEFVRLPGRPASGTTPQEAMNQSQRAYNKVSALIIEHTNLTANPIKIIDTQSGIEESMITNRPGLNLKVNRRDRIPPFEWVAPPPLSQDAYRTLQFLRQEIDDTGNLAGTEGDAPTEDASGELVKELRFNSDRFLGPTMRRAAEEFARMAEDWKVILPVIYDEEQILSYAGADNVARTIMVKPEMFAEGSVNALADVESMLPEGRGERQKNITALYSNGLFGAPGTPQAISTFFELSQFPHLGRAGKFGGVHRITADQENGQLLQGVPFHQIPVFDWYNDMVHLLSHEEFMSSPEFLKVDPVIQQGFANHRQMHIMNIFIKTGQAAEADPEGGEAGDNQFSGNSSPEGGGAAGSPEGAPTSEAAAGDAVGGQPQSQAQAPGAAGQ